jgi:spore germination protein KB
MAAQPVSTRQGISILALFVLGSTVVLAPGRVANRDMWMAVLVAFAMAVPLAFLYGRLSDLCPSKSLYDMQLELLGPVFGRITMVIFTVFSFHLGALVIRNFLEYIQSVSFQYSPQFMFALPIGILCIWSVRAGIGTLRRWAVVVMPVFLIILIALSLLSKNLWNIGNLTPVLYDGFKPVFTGAINILGFPFMETIMLVFIFKPLEKKKGAYKIFLSGFAIGAVLLTIFYARNTLVLSYEQINKYYFPSYEVVSLINIGDFIQGIQAIMVFIFLIGGLVKGSVCLYVAAEGTARLTGQGYRSLTAPVGLLMITFSLFVSKDITDMFSLADPYYKYYVLPIGLFIPVLLWIVAEWKHHKSKKANVPVETQ